MRLLRFLCLFMVLIGSLAPVAPQAYAETSSVAPLPRRCGRILPPDSGDPACCMFGYVFLDGQPVEGARVTVSIPTSQEPRVVWTELGSDSPQPYYSLDLSAAPLRAIPGSEVTITVEYGGHTHTITHEVQTGGQQVDVVIPLGATDGYVFDRQFWKQAPAEAFNRPVGIATDSSQAIYVVDRDNARVKVYNADGILLPSRGWGTRGGGPGEFVDPTGIAIDALGDVYVLDSGNARVQKFTATGQWITMWGSFGAGAAQFKYPQAIAVAPNGSVYVADTGNGRVQQFDRNGRRLDSIDRGDQGGTPFFPQALTVDPAGNLYIAAGNEASSSIQRAIGPFRIQRRSPNSVWSVLSSTDQFTLPMGLVSTPNGSLLVLDSDTGSIQQRSSASGSGTWTTLALGANPAQALSSPAGITVSTNGQILVSDSGNDRIQLRTSSGAFVRSWGQRGSTEGQFSEPRGLAVDRDGNLYVADTRNHRIQHLAPDGRVLALYDERNSAPGGFNRPGAVALDAAGNLYVADTNNNRVQILNMQTKTWSTWGNYGEALGELFFPSGIAIGPDNLVYLADMDRHRIQYFTLDGDYQGFYGRPGNQAGGDAGEFGGPRGLAFDRNGNLFVTEYYNQRIQRRSPSGVWTIIGRPGEGPGEFTQLDGIAIDRDGNIYVADQCNYRLQKLTGSGAFIAAWGRQGNLEGEFQCPAGVAVTHDGLVYAADTEGNRIQRFRPRVDRAPIATIVSAGPLRIQAGTPIRLIGRAQSGNKPLGSLTYEWRLNGAAPFETTANATLQTTNLSDGIYRVSLRARDAQGRVSDLQEVTFTVGRGGIVAPTSRTKWGMLLYLAGDNDAAVFMDDTPYIGALWRLARAGPNPNVTVVALFDGPEADDTQRVILRPNGTIEKDFPEEVNTGDPQTLVDFVRWGMEQADADRYYLSIADHADAIDGIAFDTTSGPEERLTNIELRSALMQITEGGSRPIDILHLDGCLMGTVENAYQLRGVADTVIASAYLGWSVFAYEEYRGLIGSTTEPKQLAGDIAETYAALVAERELPYTIVALDLAGIDQVAQRIATLTNRLLAYARTAPANRQQLVSLREQAQKYDSNYDSVLDQRDVYIDVRHWAALLNTSVSDAEIASLARGLISDVDALEIFGQVGSGSAVIGANQSARVSLEQATGVGIYYPAQAGNRTYLNYVRGLEFPAVTRWDSLIADTLTPLPPALNEREVIGNPPLPFTRTATASGNRIYLPLLRR